MICLVGLFPNCKLTKRQDLSSCLGFSGLIQVLSMVAVKLYANQIEGQLVVISVISDFSC